MPPPLDAGRDSLVHGSARPGAKGQRCFNPEDKVTEQEGRWLGGSKIIRQRGDRGGDEWAGMGRCDSSISIKILSALPFRELEWAGL